MSTNDWGTTANDWQAGPTKRPTFKQDLGGFAFISGAIWRLW